MYLATRIGQADELRLCATVLLRELADRGYDGGITQLRKAIADASDDSAAGACAARRLGYVRST